MHDQQFTSAAGRHLGVRHYQREPQQSPQMRQDGLPWLAGRFGLRPGKVYPPDGSPLGRWWWWAGPTASSHLWHEEPWSRCLLEYFRGSPQHVQTLSFHAVQYHRIFPSSTISAGNFCSVLPLSATSDLRVSFSVLACTRASLNVCKRLSIQDFTLSNVASSEKASSADSLTKTLSSFV